MPAKASPGRPRSERARTAVLAAARALVREGGYAAATIEAIAERSGVAKTTIYRWWPNRPALVVDVLMQMATATVPVPSGPDPLRALRSEMRGIASVAERAEGRLLVALVGEAQRDPRVRKALVSGLFEPRQAASAGAVRRAQESGAVRKDVPAQLAVELLVGPIFYRLFVGHQPLSDAFVSQVYRHVLEGLEARPKSRRRGA